MAERPGRAAKVLAIALAVLYALFALDPAVLSVGFLVRLLPATLVLGAAARAWNRPRQGATLFAVTFLASVPLLRTWSAPARFVWLSLPLAAIALLLRAAAGRRPAV